MSIHLLLIKITHLLVATGLVLSMNSQAAIDCAKDEIKIMPIGDSITQGGRKPGEYSYRLPLSQFLKAAGYRVDFIGSQHALEDENFAWPQNFDNDHEGYYGETTWSIHDTFMENTKVLPSLDIALIQVGNNDLSKWDHFSAVLSPLSSIVNRLREKNPNVTILLSELNHDWSSSKYLRAHLKIFASYYNTSASPIITIPHYKNWDTKKDTLDGMHPNQNGQKKMAKLWFEYIKKTCDATLG